MGLMCCEIDEGPRQLLKIWFGFHDRSQFKVLGLGDNFLHFSSRSSEFFELLAGLVRTKYERIRQIRQRQRRLNDSQVVELAFRYRGGATQLATEFNIDRRTVPDRLKKAGVGMRLQSPTRRDG